MKDMMESWGWGTLGFCGFWAIVAGFSIPYGSAGALISGGILALLVAYHAMKEDD